MLQTSVFSRHFLRKGLSLQKPSPIFSSSISKRGIQIDSSKSLPVRTPNDSRRKKILDFTHDESLRARYLNPVGDIRFGLILEDLDSLAGAVAYSHAILPSQGSENLAAVDELLIKPRANQPFRKFDADLTIVTASCNRIQLFKRLLADRTLELEGVVTWVGKSSMEVRIQVNQRIQSVSNQVVEAFFTMVARNKANRAENVFPLKLTNPEEEKLFMEGAEHSQLRKLAAKVSLENMPPSDEERQLIHDLFIETRKFTSPHAVVSFPADEYVYMKDTIFQSTILMQPQERNIHNKIFGGYLMRKAFELAWSNAYCFSGVQAAFKAMNDTYFLAPVEIGDIVLFTSQVIFTSGNSLLVNVAADVISPQQLGNEATVNAEGEQVTFPIRFNKARKRTNTFQFSFECPQLKQVRKVLPLSYEEAVMYVQGRRELMRVKPESLSW